MKKLLLIFTIAMITAAFYSFTTKDSVINTNVPADVEYSVPADVQAIIDKSCFECHNSDGRTAGKMKLKFEKIPGYKHSKQVGKLLKIKKVVAKESMPPKKFIEKFPEKVLTAKENEKLINWAEDMALKLGGE